MKIYVLPLLINTMPLFGVGSTQWISMYEMWKNLIRHGVKFWVAPKKIHIYGENMHNGYQLKETVHIRTLPRLVIVAWWFFHFSRDLVGRRSPCLDSMSALELRSRKICVYDIRGKSELILLMSSYSGSKKMLHGGLSSFRKSITSLESP